MLIRAVCRNATTALRQLPAVTTSGRCLSASDHLLSIHSRWPRTIDTTRVGTRSQVLAIRQFSSSTATASEDGDTPNGAHAEQDELLTLLETMMHKRDLLLARRDASAQTEVAKAVGELDGLHALWQEWQAIQKNAANLLRMTDPDIEPDEAMREMAVEEARELFVTMDECRDKILQELLPHDATDEQSALIEIRPGVGGGESAVFTAEIARMYHRFCSEVRPEDIGLGIEGGAHSFTVERMSAVAADVNSSSKNAAPEAYKEVILCVRGKGAYGVLRNEAGVQRVQRVPVTVSVTKIQTSTIAVLVLPLSEQSASSADMKDDIVDPKDVKEEVMRSRGAGGQHVNKTESAIRLTHEPTGITVSMQDSRSQQQNRVKAWQVLRARLTDRKLRQDEADVRDQRRSQISSMDRFDRVRTFNFMQDRVTDHRVPVTTNDIANIMEGDASESSGLVFLMRALKERREKLRLIDLRSQVESDIVSLKQSEG